MTVCIRCMRFVCQALVRLNVLKTSLTTAFKTLTRTDFNKVRLRCRCWGPPRKPSPWYLLNLLNTFVDYPTCLRDMVHAIGQNCAHMFDCMAFPYLSVFRNDRLLWQLLATPLFSFIGFAIKLVDCSDQDLFCFRSFSLPMMAALLTRFLGNGRLRLNCFGQGLQESCSLLRLCSASGAWRSSCGSSSIGPAKPIFLLVKTMCCLRSKGARQLPKIDFPRRSKLQLRQLMASNLRAASGLNWHELANHCLWRMSG